MATWDSCGHSTITLAVKRGKITNVLNAHLAISSMTTEFAAKLAPIVRSSIVLLVSVSNATQALRSLMANARSKT